MAHIPYHELVDDVLVFMGEQDIKVSEVGTAFPLKNKISDIYLNGDDRAFKKFDINEDKYILYSNVMNDFQSEQIFELDNLWTPLYYRKKGNVDITLYKRK